MVAVPDSMLSATRWEMRGNGGVRLVGESIGPAAGIALLFVHGFGQVRGAWTGSARTLAERGWHCVNFDARGHGDSAWCRDGSYRLQQFVDDLKQVAAPLDRPVVIGASMGGLLGLLAAAESRPVPFRALVLVDITPRWEPAGVARILAFMRAHPEGFGDVEEVAAEVARYLPQRQARKRSEQLVSLLRRGADGRLHWHWDPALLDSVAVEGQKAQPRLLAAARQLSIPTLLVSGGRSDVVSDDTVAEFLDLSPLVRHVQLAHATHHVAGDAGDALTREIEMFAREPA